MRTLAHWLSLRTWPSETILDAMDRNLKLPRDPRKIPLPLRKCEYRTRFCVIWHNVTDVRAHARARVSSRICEQKQTKMQTRG